jgi:uncharacterized protein (DUF1697 family)
MDTYISILRGINVSGHNKIKMDALKKLYEDIGFKQVQTYIQSGNVLFREKKSDGWILGKKISEKIAEMFGFAVPVLVKDLAEMETVLNNNPFVNERNSDIKTLHVTFLSRVPEPADIAKLSVQAGNDEFIISSNVIYLYCPDGYGRTKLSNSYFENKLKIVATTRNWKSIMELVNLAKAM